MYSWRLWDYVLVAFLSPLFFIRVLHWLVDRVIFPDLSAAEAIDSFYNRFSANISTIEVRPGRHISLLWLRHTNDQSSKGLIVFVHGSCARMQQFENQLQYFYKIGYDVVSYDALGCGRSAKPVGESLYTTREMYLDLIELLRYVVKERGSRPLMVVGHSFGGALMTKLASSSDGPTVSESFVSICQPTPSSRGRNNLSVFQLPLTLLWLIRPLLGLKARELLLGPLATDQLRRQEKEASARNPVHMFRAFYNGFDMAILDPKNSDYELRAPILYIAAEFDRICQPGEIQTLASKVVPKSDFEIVRNCGHQCMQENPMEVNRIIEKYMASLPTKRN
jgi:pimeloyl-ACP methyl ester carboxylesterase